MGRGFSLINADKTENSQSERWNHSWRKPQQKERESRWKVAEFAKIEDFVKIRHSGENRSPENLLLLKNSGFRLLLE